MPVFNTSIQDAEKTVTKIFNTSTNQVVGVYDICTASGGDVWIDIIGFYVSQSATGLTAISVQTDDAVPLTILTSTEGLLANLVTGTNLVQAFSRRFVLASGKKIQLSILTTNGTGGNIRTIIRTCPTKAGATIV